MSTLLAKYANHKFQGFIRFAGELVVRASVHFAADRYFLAVPNRLLLTIDSENTTNSESRQTSAGFANHASWRGFAPAAVWTLQRPGLYSHARRMALGGP